MTCIHGRDEHDPIEPFANDAEYRAYIGLPNTAKGDRLFAALPPEERVFAEQCRMFERMLKRGEIPKGAIACTRAGGHR
jgi:hypothetical protein